MATSSIFESVRIKGEKNAEAFIDAYEASLKEAENNPNRNERLALTDQEKIKAIMAKGRKYHVG